MNTKTKQQESAPSLLVDNLELCRMLGINPDTWRKRVGAGLAPLPLTRMGSRNYYRRVDVLAFVRHGEWPEHMKFKSVTPRA